MTKSQEAPTNFKLGEIATIEPLSSERGLTTGRIVYLEVWGALAGLPRQAALVVTPEGERVLGTIAEASR